jgi:hypothetical protein
MIFSFTSWLETDPYSIEGFDRQRNVFVFERNVCFLGFLEAEVQQQIVENRFQLHQRKSRSNAVSWSNAKWHVGVRIDGFAIFFAESRWIEFLRIWEVLRIVVEAVNWNHEIVVLGKVKSFSIKLQIVVLNASSLSQLWREIPSVSFENLISMIALPVQ